MYNELGNTDSIMLHYIEDNDSYRISLFDNNGHYMDEFFLNKNQLYDLKNILNTLNITIEETL